MSYFPEFFNKSACEFYRVGDHVVYFKLLPFFVIFYFLSTSFACAEERKFIILTKLICH